MSSSSEESNDPPERCMICLDSLPPKADAVTTLCCNKVFHPKCLAPSFLTTESRCPHCRAKDIMVKLSTAHFLEAMGTQQQQNSSSPIILLEKVEEELKDIRRYIVHKLRRLEENEELVDDEAVELQEQAELMEGMARRCIDRIWACEEVIGRSLEIGRRQDFPEWSDDDDELAWDERFEPFEFSHEVQYNI